MNTEPELPSDAQPPTGVRVVLENAVVDRLTKASMQRGLRLDQLLADLVVAASLRIDELLSGRGKNGSGGRTLSTLAAVALVASLLWAIPTAEPAQAAESPFRLVGELPIGGTSPESVPLLAEPRSGRILALANTKIDAYDAYTLKHVNTLSLAPHQLGTARVVYAWGPGQKFLYLWAFNTLLVVDPVSLTLLSARDVSSVLPVGVSAAGMSYYAPDDRLYVVGETKVPFVGYHGVLLSELDATTGVPTWDRPFALGATCQTLMRTNLQAAVHRPEGTTKVYVPCGTGGAVIAREPGVPGIVSVDITDPSAPSTRVFAIAGAYALSESAVDPVASRMVITSAGPGVPSQAAWVFDEVHEAVIGVVSAGDLNVNGLGVDAIGGRVYVVVDGTLLTTAHQGEKIGQATAIPVRGIARPTVTAIPFARRLIIAAPIGSDPIVRIGVYENNLPEYKPPPPVDPDAGTIDVAESPGRTGANFGGDAKAFGSRVHQVAGADGLLQNIFVRNGDYWTLLQAGKTGVNDGDRDAHFSRVIGGRLADGEASGQGVNVDGDATTRSDYRVVTQPQAPPVSVGSTTVPPPPPTPPPPGGSWPYTAATCSDLGGGRDKATAPEASATCDLAKARVEVETSHENSNVIRGLNADATAPLISFGSSSSSTKLVRDPKLGLVVETRAESRDVVLGGGVVRIGKISSISRSTAAGRPKTAAASYERVFEDVFTPSGSCDDDCHPQEVVDDINTALAPKFSAELPEFELVASPRGALGSVLRDPWKHRQDVVLNNQDETGIEIPALRLIYVNDNGSRSRILFEFAATMASSSYAIYRLDDFDEYPGDDADLADLFAGSAVGDIDEAAFGDIPGGGDASLDDGRLLDSGDSSLIVSSRSRGGLGLVGNNLRLLLTGRRALLLNALLWSLLGLPAFVVGRRRYLLRLIGSPR